MKTRTKTRPQKGNNPKLKPHASLSDKMNSNQCHKCGSSSAHAKRDCPATDVKCHSCGKKGHYKRVCASLKAVREVCEGDPIFLGSVMGWKAQRVISMMFWCGREQRRSMTRDCIRCWRKCKRQASLSVLRSASCRSGKCIS
uniref:CCHC-type domain-containing protein n=1 Tax=Sinocyclocheilus grahami TaxID=75366 RepID=A0A672SD31_SINGR